MTRATRRSPSEHGGPLRRLLDVWGFVPDLSAPHQDVHLTARDGVRLAGSYLPGPAATSTPQQTPAVLLAHGFAGHRRKPAYALLAEQIAERAAVLTLDLRGHGGSQGRSTLGDREALDVRAGGAWLRHAGHRWIAAIGVSMGGTAVLRAVGGGPRQAFDAVCAISAPAEFIRDETPAVRVLAWTMTSNAWRRLMQLAWNVRIAHAWGAPVDAIGLIHAIAPTPLLVVHGEDDHYFAPDHARRLYDHARDPKTLWLEPAGFGHAEDGLTAAFTARFTDALVAVRTDGRWPSA